MHELSRHSLITGAGALCSRLLGFARDAAMAWLLGGTASADALSAALRLPYMARRLLGEGTLSMALTTACSRSPRPATLALAVTRRLTLIAGLAVLAGLVWAEPLVLILAPGLGGQGNLPEAVTLLRLALPYVLFAVLAAGHMAALHSRGLFALPALTPTLFNSTVLLFALMAATLPGHPGIWLATGVSCGGVIQWLVQTPAVQALRLSENKGESRCDNSGENTNEKKGERPCESACKNTYNSALLSPRRLRAALQNMPGGIAGAAFPQLAFVVAAALASLAPAGHMSALFYAERLLEFPLGIVGAAVGMAATPVLARLARTHGPEKLAAEAHKALLLTLAFNLPAAAGLMAVSTPLVVLVLGHGAFDERAAHLTAFALCAYGPGLPAYALSRPLLGLCLAVGDRRTPLMATCVALPISFGVGASLLALTQGGWWPDIAQLAGFADGASLTGFASAFSTISATDLSLLAPPLGVSVGLWCHVFVLWKGVQGRIQGHAKGRVKEQVKTRVNLQMGLLLKPVCLYVTGSVLTYEAARQTLLAMGAWSTTTELAATLALAVTMGMLTYALVVTLGRFLFSMPFASLKNGAD